MYLVAQGLNSYPTLFPVSFFSSWPQTLWFCLQKRVWCELLNIYRAMYTLQCVYRSYCIVLSITPSTGILRPACFCGGYYLTYVVCMCNLFVCVCVFVLYVWTLGGGGWLEFIINLPQCLEPPPRLCIRNKPTVTISKHIL